MNRRQAIRTGAIAITGMSSLGTTSLFQSGAVKAQNDELPRFGSLPFEPIITSSVSTTNRPFQNLKVPFTILQSGREAAVVLSTPRAEKALATNDLADQFFAFQTAMKDGKPTLLEASEIEPTIETNDSNPDVVLDVSLQAFHIGENEPINNDARATMRLTLNKDDDSQRARTFDTLFWTITAGLKLYDDVKNKRAESGDYRKDFRKAFGNRIVEIPGALGDVTFEVIKHKEPPWWRKVFKFLESDGGKTLMSAIGFPAVTQAVVAFVDDAVSRFEGSSPQVLFASRPMKLAFSKQAREDYIASGPVKIGSLNPGFWVLGRGRDFSAMANAKAYFHATMGRLIPSDIPLQDVYAGNYTDPFKNITYAVIKVQMKARRLDYDF